MKKLPFVTLKNGQVVDQGKINEILNSKNIKKLYKDSLLDNNRRSDVINYRRKPPRICR
ncbi:MAG: hypothetical protein ACD_12C00648G0003 [uncultured bacterium]|nr:MAG: hypothetical protein ACD_12C00648G0003 [uncultured bacterium]